MGLNDYRVEIGDNEKLFHINMMKKYYAREVDHDTALASIVLEQSKSESGEDNPISNNEETVSLTHHVGQCGLCQRRAIATGRRLVDGMHRAS